MPLFRGVGAAVLGRRRRCTGEVSVNSSGVFHNLLQLFRRVGAAELEGVSQRTAYRLRVQ